MLRNSHHVTLLIGMFLFQPEAGGPWSAKGEPWPLTSVSVSHAVLAIWPQNIGLCLWYIVLVKPAGWWWWWWWIIKVVVLFRI